MGDGTSHGSVDSMPVVAWTRDWEYPEGKWIRGEVFWAESQTGKKVDVSEIPVADDERLNPLYRDPPDVVELKLCEVQHLALRPNVLYRFTVDFTCDACKEAHLASLGITEQDIAETRPEGVYL